MDSEGLTAVNVGLQMAVARARRLARYPQRAIFSMLCTRQKRFHCVLTSAWPRNVKQREPNIDDLLQVVTESVAAYRICNERIDAVDKALQAALKDGGPAPT